MKYLLSALTALLLFTTAIAQKPAANAKPTEVIKFDKTEYDFGTIVQNKPVSYNFIFKNISKAPVVIENATASCGCTTPEWVKTPIMAKKGSTIKAGFNAAAPGVFDKTITVKIQGQQLPVELRIKGKVVAAEEFAKLPAKSK